MKRIVGASQDQSKKPPEECGEETYLVEQYANQVLDFSNQYGSDRSFSYTAANCLGCPNKFPAYGDFPQTFVMRDYGRWWEKCPSGRLRQKLRRSTCNVAEDEIDEVSDDEWADNFLELRFEHSVFVHAVYVYETFNPGSIVSIWGGDCKGTWKLLWKGPPKCVGHQPRQFCPPVAPTNFAVNQIRIHFNQRHLPYYAEIDAVCLLGTLTPMTLEARLLSTLPPAEQRGPILTEVVRRNLYVYNQPIVEQIPLLEVEYLPLDEAAVANEDRHSDNGHFDILPREVVLHIFQFLNFYTLVQCCQVSKLFRQVACDPLLYVRLHLKPLFYCVTNDTFKFLFGKTHYLQYLDLSWCGNYGRVAPHVLRTFLYSRGSNLCHLLLANCHVATMDVIEIVGATCKNLVEIDLSNCHILDTGSFYDLRHLCNLKSLNLYRTQICRTELKAILMANKDLECVNVASCLQVDADDICTCLAKHCPKLKTLDMWRSPSLTARGVYALATMSSLLELDLGWCVCVNATTGCIRTLANGCTSLNKLFLAAHRQTSDADLSALSLLGVQLRQLNIMGTRNVTPTGVLTLAQSCTDLQLLDIGYCEQLETHEFLRSLHELLPNCHIVSSFNNT